MKALLVLYPECVYYEVSTAISILKDHQVEIITATTDGEQITTLENLMIQPQLNFKQALFYSYDFILIPGGSCDDVMGDQDLVQLLLKASPSTIIGAICNGVLVLAQTGLLDEKHCTHTAHPKYADPIEFKALLDIANPIFESTHYLDQNIVIEGNIVTAKPWAQIEFAVTLARVGELISEAKAASLLNYYRGQL